tara:strand:+ start:142 stop:738 length:597 start_codon:yes stop_codon:yes gene_type:complete
MDKYGENPYHYSTIYKISCNETNEVYIGSTIERMRNRMAHHKGVYSRCSSKQIINRNNYKVEIIEKYKCECKSELRQREQEVINNHKNEHNIINERNCSIIIKTQPRVVNKVGAIPLEKTEAQVAHRKEYQKKLGEAYRNGDKREEYLNKKKEYALKNKAVIRAKQSEVIQCECGGTYTRSHKSTHCKSKKHLDNLPA